MNTERFTGKSGDYAAARPAYPAALAAWLARKGIGEGVRVADIGAGTGKFTAQLLGLGATVTAVEPNADMRACLAADLGAHPRCQIVDATAEATGLAPTSVDLVTAAQAFHWFDAAAFARECARILAPEGKVCLVWNNRVPSAAVNAATAEVSRAFCPAFGGFSNGKGAEDAETAAFFAPGYEKIVFVNDLRYLRESFVRRQLSASYAPTDASARDAYAHALGALFDRFSQNGELTVPNETVAWWGGVRR